MTNIIYLLIVLATVFALVYHDSPKQKDEMMNIQQENHRVRETAMINWPSFNDNSYIYILGLFLKQHTSMLITPEERAMFMSAILLSQKKNITLNGKQFAYRLEETNGHDIIDALDRTCLSITENQILGIVGPTSSYETKTLVHFCNRSGLPVLGYATTEPELSDRNVYQTFYRMSPSDTIMAAVLLKLFQKYDWNSTNIIYQSDSYGQGGLRALTEFFGDAIKISCVIKYDLFTDQIENFRHQLEESSSRIVLVWATSEITTNIIELAVKEGNILAPDFLWILTAANLRMQLNDKQLIGTLLIRSVSPQTFDMPINRTLLKDAIDIWKTYDPQSCHDDDKQIDTYALYAFDSAWMLILAFQELCQQTSTDCSSLVNTSYCFDSRLINRKELHNIMQTMDFLGVSGHIQFHGNTTDRIMHDGLYFLIDNLQLSKANKGELHVVEVLRFNDSTSNINYKSAAQWTESENAIQWPRDSNIVPLHYALLEGKTLNITVYISPPFYMEKFYNYSNGTYEIVQEGYIFDLILLLEQRMKFHRNITVAPIHTTYNELVNCVENRTYDIVMADLTKTANRLNQIDFSVSIYDNTMRMIVRKSTGRTTPIMAFLKPFHYSLWLSIFFVIYLFSAFIIAIFEFIDGKERSIAIDVDNLNINTPSVSDIYYKSKTETLFRSMYHTIGGLVQRGTELQARTSFSRFQTVLVWLMSVILVALFTSNMVQYFATEREKSWIQSIEDLKMCGKIGCNRIGITEQSHHADYFKKEVMNDIEINYYHLNHSLTSYTKLLDYHIDVAIVDSSSADYITQTDHCDIEMAGLPFGRTNFGVAIPKHWIYKDDLDKNLMDLRTGSAFDTLLIKWFQQKNCDREDEIKNNGFGDGLTLLQTRGLFILFSIFTTINIILFILKRSGFFNTENRQCLSNKIRECFRVPVSPLSDQSSIQHHNDLPNLSNNDQRMQQTTHEIVHSLSINNREQYRESESKPS
ncbi:unnamed protein product [Adineta steineri]|uniref:Ionotropic glutamate receptor C-terminal domain-containing protein n=1 Tax=Adineta steineri TaxID=433720 RepID=A0A814PFC4_9BILA|nr:unnamed protein product [Adineta steineri]CAF1537611.1 unnamed protein product [Adineta steineri]